MAPDREGWILRKKEIISTLTAHSQAVLQCWCTGHTLLIDLHCRLLGLGKDLASFPGCRCLKPSIIPGQRPSVLLTRSLIWEYQYTWPPDKQLTHPQMKCISHGVLLLNSLLTVTVTFVLFCLAFCLHGNYFAVTFPEFSSTRYKNIWGMALFLAMTSQYNLF